MKAEGFIALTVRQFVIAFNPVATRKLPLQTPVNGNLCFSVLFGRF